MLDGFDGPSPGEFLEQLGVEPVALDEPWQYDLVVTDGVTGIVKLSVDEHANWFGCTWTNDGIEMVRMSREGARALSIRNADGETFVDVRFDGASRGLLSVRLFPSFALVDEMLIDRP
jgi:hypothetical protein